MSEYHPPIDSLRMGSRLKLKNGINIPSDDVQCLDLFLHKDSEMYVAEDMVDAFKVRVFLSSLKVGWFLIPKRYFVGFDGEGKLVS